LLEAFASLQCSAPWNGCVVHHTGLVFPCCHICEDHASEYSHSRNMILGDLNHDSLHDILNGEAAWRLRRAWVEGDLTGTCCHHCHMTFKHACSPYFRTDAFVNFIARTYRFSGGKLHQERFEPFPLERLEIQTNSTCQLRCTFCRDDYAPTGAPELLVPGHMDVDLFERILDEAIELGGSGADLYTHWYGEPLVHPHKERIYEITGHRPFFATCIVTNGVLLDPPFVDHLLSLPCPPGVYVSLHATTREAYEATTGSDRYPRIRRNVANLLESRRRAGRENDMNIYIGVTVVEQNVHELEGFIHEWRGIFTELDQAPAIHFNGRGRPSRNTLIVVTDGEDPYSDAMRRGFWIIENAQSDTEPSHAEIERLAATDAWRQWRDPSKEFMDLAQRLEQCAIYAGGERSRRRFRHLLASLLLRQGHFETATLGRVSEQTAGRLMGVLDDRTGGWAALRSVRRTLTRSHDLELKISPQARREFRTRLRLDLSPAGRRRRFSRCTTSRRAAPRRRC
jgi:sulfatase maturation enzyme AslB (radical SAM superfamily)